MTSRPSFNPIRLAVLRFMTLRVRDPLVVAQVAGHQEQPVTDRRCSDLDIGVSR
jgi:hypothetical protein